MLNRPPKLIFSVLVILFPIITIAQNQLSLEQAIQLGLEMVFKWGGANLSQSIAENQNEYGNAGFYPEINANGSYSQNIENTKLDFADGKSVNQDNAVSSNLNANLAMNWIIFDGTKMFITKSKLEELESLSELNLQLNINNKVAEIITTYTQIAAEQQNLEAYQSQLEITKQRSNLSKKQLEIGSGSALALSKAQVDQNADQALVTNQEVNVLRAKVKLNRLLGRNVEEEFSISDTISFTNNLSLENLMQAVEQNPNLSMYKKEIGIAVLEKREISAQRLPKIGISGRYNYGKSESEAGFVRSNQVDGINYGASISIPIFNGMNLNRQEQNNRIKVEQSKLAYEETLSSIKEQILVNYKTYESNLIQIGFEQKNVILAKKNVDFAIKNYELGGISSLELREIQLAYLNAKQRLIDVKYLTKTAETELLRLSNQLVSGQ